MVENLHWMFMHSDYYRMIFEDIATLMFCTELGLDAGLSKRINQRGIESFPVCVGEKCYAYQAKYYDASTKLYEHKQNLIACIETAASWNVTDLFMYINRNLPGKNPITGKEARYIQEIENAASQHSLILHWRTKSWIEASLDMPKFADIRTQYFGSGKEIKDYYDYDTFYRFVGDKNKLRNTLENTVQVYDESGQILLYNPSVKIPKKEIVLPSKEIITGVNVLQASLVKEVQNNPELLYSMSPSQFEEFVAEMYERQGYKVELTKMTRDGGKDLILYTDGPIGHNMFYVECKKYQKNHLVGVGIVRNFYGVVEADKATAGILITSSSFTPDAKSFQNQIQYRMHLVDYMDLLNQVAGI